MADIFSGDFYPKGLTKAQVNSPDTLWLQIVPRKMAIDLSLNKREDNVLNTTTSEAVMWFLMPKQFAINYNHTWEDLTSPGSAFRSIKSKFTDQAKMAGGTAGLTTITHGNKADNPHMYSNTSRRAFTLPFEFSVYSDAYRDVQAPIDTIVRYSCPSYVSGDSTKFEFPFVFNLQTYTGDGRAVDIVSIKSVGITVVQSTTQGPWIGGFPSHAAVDIGFVDLNPLHRESLATGKKNITVGSA